MVSALVLALALAATPSPDTTSFPLLDSIAVDSAATAAATTRDYLAEMRAAFTEEDRDYWGIKTALALIEPLAGILIGLLILFSGLSAKLRDVAFTMGRSRWVRLLVFFVLYLLISYALTFPLTWYDAYALEHQYGLSHQGLGSWLADQGKSIMVILVAFGVVPVLWLIYTILHRSPGRWWLWLALLTLPFVLGATLLEPLVFDPLFNRFTPLQDKRLESRIVALAERAGIPGRRVLEANKSAQTSKYNAYVNGFGVSQRIVLWDTTLQGMEEDEILYVVGHEIGHYVLGHIWKGIVEVAVASFLGLWLVARLARWTVRRFGHRLGFQELSDPASLPLLVVCLSLVMMLAQPVYNALSRRVESQADVYGLEITRDNDAAARAFLKLGAQNRSNPDPPLWIEILLYTHPSLGERVRLALSYRPWEDGKPNRFYRDSERSLTGARRVGS